MKPAGLLPKNSVFPHERRQDRPCGGRAADSEGRREGISDDRLIRVLATVLLAGSAATASGQIAAPNEAGVAMGHLHYHVRDVEANARFWVALGGERGALGETTVIMFPDVLVFLDEGDPSGGPRGRS